MSHQVRQVLLVDDHELVRKGLTILIDSQADFEVCGEAVDAPSAMRLISQNEPDAAIVDLMLQEGSGIELIKQIKAQHPSVRMLVCSMHDDNLYAERALQAGAMGYVNKNDPTDRIVEGLRRILAGQIYVRSDISDRILQRVAQRGEEGHRPAVETLSDRELEVLEFLGQGLGTRQIAEKLNLSAKTIDTYRENLKAKLNLESATALIRYAVTWRLDPDSLGEESSSRGTQMMAAE